MIAAEQRIADLERQLAALTAEVAGLRDIAFVLKTLAEMRTEPYAPVPVRGPRRSPASLRLVATGGAL